MSRSGGSTEKGEKGAGTSPSASAFDRLVEIEKRLDRAVTEARREADARVKEARENARRILEGLEEELEHEAAEIRARVERQTEPDAAAIEEDADRRVAAWESLSDAEVRELAGWMVREVVRGQAQAPSGGRE